MLVSGFIWDHAIRWSEMDHHSQNESAKEETKEWSFSRLITQCKVFESKELSIIYKARWWRHLNYSAPRRRMLERRLLVDVHAVNHVAVTALLRAPHAWHPFHQQSTNKQANRRPNTYIPRWFCERTRELQLRQQVAIRWEPPSDPTPMLLRSWGITATAIYCNLIFSSWMKMTMLMIISLGV
jgi:hypothetical protein